MNPETLRARLESAEYSRNVAFRILEAERQIDWRERYLSLHKIHCEDVRRRKEMRRFRLANFSVEEIKRELQRRHVDLPTDTWLPIDDGQYDGVIKACQVKVNEGGRSVQYAMRSRTHSHRWQGFQPIADVRLCKLQPKNGVTT